MSETPPKPRVPGRDAPAPLPKRFYKDVGLGATLGGFAILLDGRPVKTPSKNGLLLPREALADRVATEWASWCRHPGYIVGALGAEGHYAGFRAPLRLVWIADDSYAPLPAAKALLGFYPASPSEFLEVHPKDIGEGRIGHFGFFRERFRDTLWRQAADWLQEKR